MANFVQQLKDKNDALTTTVEVYDDLIEKLFDRLDEFGDESESTQVLREHYYSFKEAISN